jgi:Sec-independent protein translocase protein TatA
MFGLGFWETVIIVLVIVVLVKPSDLPGFLRKAGQFIGKAQAAYDTLRRAIRRIEEEDRKLGPPPGDPGPLDTAKPDAPQPAADVPVRRKRTPGKRKAVRSGKARR